MGSEQKLHTADDDDGGGALAIAARFHHSQSQLEHTSLPASSCTDAAHSCLAATADTHTDPRKKTRTHERAEQRVQIRPFRVPFRTQLTTPPTPNTAALGSDDRATVRARDKCVRSARNRIES